MDGRRISSLGMTQMFTFLLIRFITGSGFSRESAATKPKMDPLYSD